MNPSLKEKLDSQIPAFQLLVQLGYSPLQPSQCKAARRTGRAVLLEDILIKRLMAINSFSHKGTRYPFDIADAHEALRKLKAAPNRIGSLATVNQDIYDLLVLGTTITKSIGGDSKSYSFRYIDWDSPSNNAFHVSPEMSVERSISGKNRRCDLVAFVNGIPFVVIENKSPQIALKKAESQLIKYQRADNIPQLFYYGQMLMSMNRRDGRYATVGTPTKFWSPWVEKEDKDADLQAIIDQPIKDDLKDMIFQEGFEDGRAYFSEMEQAGFRTITPQDRLIYALCRKERLLDMVRRYTVFDGGVRKIARHQQFDAIRKTLKRVKERDSEGKRGGGIIWHTQGSGKSLTMVMLGRALVLDTDIIAPRLIIVTDRVNLDKQITATFRSCELSPVRATTGSKLMDHIRDKKPLITSVVNKFRAGVARYPLIDEDPNIFVLVDESHRSQTGKLGGFSEFGTAMRRIIPKASFIGFTGTPLLKKNKNSFDTFGALIDDYRTKEAEDDGAIVPLLYEGRMVDQQVSGTMIDVWFEKISRGLTDEQKKDLKKKYAHMDSLSKTRQAISAKAFDISAHFRQTWKGSGFKAQLVAPSKAAAVYFKEVLDEIGDVSSAVIMSPPTEPEGQEEGGAADRDTVQKFWTSMMDKYKTEEEYNRKILDGFENGEDPEILIVVSKLLTGYDEPKNTVLYICKKMKEHTLLQAIARVNRLYEDESKEKEFGYIIDYEGLLGELDQALTTYESFEGFDEKDLQDIIHNVRDEINKLPSRHQDVLNIFKGIANKMDIEAYEQLLADKVLRDEFYEKLSNFSRCLHISLSSDKVYDLLKESQIATYKKDWKLFSDLRRSVQLRYQETINIKDYEPKIRKLLDDHVTASPAEITIELLNINDPEALKRIKDDQDITASSKADRISSATKRKITERMEEDPALYKQFSALLEETIALYRQKRINEKEYLQKVYDTAEDVAKQKGRDDLPESLGDNKDAAAFYGLLSDLMNKQETAETLVPEKLASLTLGLIQIIQSPKHQVINRWDNQQVKSQIMNAIDDYFFDQAPDILGCPIDVALIDVLQQEIIKLAKTRFK